MLVYGGYFAATRRFSHDELIAFDTEDDAFAAFEIVGTVALAPPPTAEDEAKLQMQMERRFTQGTHRAIARGQG